MTFNYPSATRCSAVDDYHGHKVPDPYKWLEDPESSETKDFIDAQNKLTFPYFESCPFREKIKARLTELWNFPRYDCPFKAGDNYYYKMNSGLQNQYVMYKLKHLDAEPEVFLDLNLFSEEGLVSLKMFKFSDDGQYMAYAISESGSDWSKIKIRSVSTHEDLPDLIKDVKYSGISWTHDNKGFFYSKLPNQDKDDGTKTSEHKFSKLYYHRLGTDQSDDVLCVEFPDKPDWITNAYVSDCGGYVVVYVTETCKNELVYYCDLKSLPGGITGPLPLKCLVGKFEAEYSYVTNDGTRFVFHTDKNAPLYRVVVIDLEQPEEVNWEVLIPEDSKNVLERVHCVNKNMLLTCHMVDVKSLLSLYDLNSGNLLNTFPLDVGHVRGCYAKRKDSEIFVYFTSFLTPGIFYYCNLAENMNLKVFREVTVPKFKMPKYETEQVFYTSKDGTKIPMFIVLRKDHFKKQYPVFKPHPTFLYGYGGFNVNIVPTFVLGRLFFLQHFYGILAIPNIRGGGEYGEKWHEMGIKFNKQNVFDDFIAAAEYLIAHKYTSPNKLIINGGSNGGLLVGACVNQRPDLFKCAIAEVGVMDMLKYHKFTIGHAWKSDYCCADDSEEDLKFLLKISPYHNVRVPDEENVQYPAVLLITGDHDDRVVPLHSLKFIAELQSKLGNCEKQTNPLMIRVDTKTGHGFGKPTSKLIDELADMYCFISNALDHQVEKLEL